MTWPLSSAALVAAAAAAVWVVFRVSEPLPLPQRGRPLNAPFRV